MKLVSCLQFGNTEKRKYIVISCVVNKQINKIKTAGFKEIVWNCNKCYRSVSLLKSEKSLAVNLTNSYFGWTCFLYKDFITGVLWSSSVCILYSRKYGLKLTLSLHRLLGLVWFYDLTTLNSIIWFIIPRFSHLYSSFGEIQSA